MSLPPVIVGLPIADRRTSYAFYGEGLGFDAVGVDWAYRLRPPPG